MTEADIEKVAKRASELVLDSIDGQITDLVMDQIYRDIGKSVVRKALWTIGIVVLIAFGWIAAKFGFKEVI
jgi:tetrahydromethanopterin S-methyltransferase subunit G